MASMAMNWLDRIGDFNPQLFREMKGQLRWRNLTIAGAISLLGQLLTLIYFYGKLPAVPQFDKFSRYCAGKPEYEGHASRFACLLDQAGNFDINWRLWWLDVFTFLSVFSVFILLLLGAHLLVSDLAREERRGTLNFIRLSPRSTPSILLGKLLGVPILLYLAAASVIPLHLNAGLAASIPMGYILSWYGVVGAIAILFYSVALVYGLATSWLGGFQAWLGSLAGFIFLLVASSRPPNGSPMDWVTLFSPLNLTAYLVPANFTEFVRLTGNSINYFLDNLNRLQWLGLPIGSNGIYMAVIMVVNAGIVTYWCWQILLRQFRNPGGTLISKRHSYLIMLSFETIVLSFSSVPIPEYYYGSSMFQEAMALNLVVCLGLVAALTPHRQALYDWARYRHMMTDVDMPGQRHRAGFRSLVQDLLWGERSPALLAIALNLAIVGTMLTLWIELTRLNGTIDSIKISGYIATIWLMMGMILVCAAIAQQLLLLQTPKRTVWAMGVVGAVVLLPPIVLGILSVSAERYPALWMLTAFPWIAFEHLSVATACLGALGQFVAFSLVTSTTYRQLQQAGASATKALPQVA